MILRRISLNINFLILYLSFKFVIYFYAKIITIVITRRCNLIKCNHHIKIAIRLIIYNLKITYHRFEEFENKRRSNIIVIILLPMMLCKIFSEELDYQ